MKSSLHPLVVAGKFNHSLYDVRVFPDEFFYFQFPVEKLCLYPPTRKSDKRRKLLFGEFQCSLEGNRCYRNFSDFSMNT